MFDDTQPQTPGQAPGTQIPVQPPMTNPNVFREPSPVSPARMSPEGPPLPPMGGLPPMQQPHRGGKRVLLFIIVGLLVVGAGVAAAAFLLPASQTPETNSTNGTNQILNQFATNTVNTNRLQNSAGNLNTPGSTSNSNLTNSSTNATTNTNTTNTAVTNVGTGNLNSTTNATRQNTNTTTNAAANANAAPATYTTDTDSDGLNDYLEGWLMTSVTNADADNDTFPDGTEVVKGFSPLGSGTLSVAGLKQHCTSSPFIVQYKFTSQEADAFCKIAGDVLTSIQVMTANSQFYENLNSKLLAGCTSFGKIEQPQCSTLVTVILGSYLTSGSAA